MNSQVTIPKLLLFDFDGVLADSLVLYEESMILTFRKLGQPIVTNRAEYLDLFEDNLFEGLTKKGVDLYEFFQVSAEIGAENHLAPPEIFSPVIPVVRELSRRHTLAIVSSNGGNTIRDSLLRHDLLPCFTEILGADSGLSKKDKIGSLLQLNGSSRDDAYYLGDTTGDIREAKQAGIKTVGVTWGWHSRDRLSAAVPDYLIDRPEELLEL